MSENFPNVLNTANVFPTSVYPPFGYNDNNMNREVFPGNNFPPNGGYPGNPNGRFNPRTTNDMYQNKSHSYNFQEAYAKPVPIIEKPNYVNHNGFIHNNVGDYVLGEQIMEYRLLIDSRDRNIKTYPNPFSFTVKFNQEGTASMDYQVRAESNCRADKYKSSTVAGPPGPLINTVFRNVKYIKLENVIIPQSDIIKKSEETGEYVFGQRNVLTDRFITLVIKELNLDFIYSTSDNVTRYNREGHPYTPPLPFALILPDKILGQDYYSGTPYYGSKTFYNSALGNISQLTIQFYNSCGELLKFEDLFDCEDLQNYECKYDKPLPVDDIRNPYNKRTQTFVSLIIGVVESQVNTNTKFEY